MVSLFALLGDVLKPKTLAGVFGGAPSVALATLALTSLKHGPGYLAREGQAMLVGGVAVLAYVLALRSLLARYQRVSAWALALPLWVVWIGVAALGKALLLGGS